MAEDEGEIIVKIPGDGGDPVVVDPATPAVTAAAADDPIEDLKSQLSTMRRTTADLTQQVAHHAARAEQATAEVAQVRGRIAESQIDTLTAGISAAQADAERAEAAYTAAFEAGDGKAMAKAQREMAGAEARKVHLEQAKADLGDDAALPTRRAPRIDDPQPTRQPQPAVSEDPFAAWTRGRTAPTVAWAEQHKDWVLDPVKSKKLTAAHFDAEADGIAPDSPAYFKHIEKFIGIAPVQKTDPQPAAQQRRPAAPVAPVTPTDGGMGGNTGGEVRLTKAERDSATDGTLVWNTDDPTGRFKKGDPIGIQEFARRKMAMIKEGRYAASYTVE